MADPSFSDLLDTCSPDSRSVLLGNGFSQAFDSYRFKYHSLLEKADLGSDEDAIRRVFEQLKTADFEAVMQHLSRMSNSLTFFETPSNRDSLRLLQHRLDRAAVKVRTGLACAISALHPPRSSELTADQYATTQAFLQHFDHIFTLNYDLLLYWTVMKCREGVDRRFSDGFRRDSNEHKLVWRADWADDPYSPQRLHFLHGALHLAQSKEKLEKLTWRRGKDESIIDQVNARLRNDRFPLLVAEGTAKQKVRQISKHVYLYYCYNKLMKASGSLFVYGVNFNTSDSHILAAIEASNIEQLFVARYSRPSSDEGIRLVTTLDACRRRRSRHKDRPSLQIEYFDYSSVPLW